MTIELGALVAVAPAVEVADYRGIAMQLSARIMCAAPDPLDTIQKMNDAIETALKNARADGVAANEHETKAFVELHRQAIVVCCAAEQRADRAEDKLREADTLIAGLQKRNRELFRERDSQLSSADDFGYRWIKAKDVLARIRAVIDEVGCDTYLARSITEILREGT